MNNLIQVRESFAQNQLTNDQLKAIKGGGWGNGGTSNGNGCPPPNAGVWRH